jgi:hypothetical protein
MQFFINNFTNIKVFDEKSINIAISQYIYDN